MKSTIFGAAAVLLLVPTGMQANDFERDTKPKEPLTNWNVENTTVPAKSTITDEMRDNLIAATFKRCLKNRTTSIGLTQTYTVAETEEYCGCFSAKSIALATPEILAAAKEINTGNWPEYMKKDIENVATYCRGKYLNMPDVTKIKQRQW